MALFDFLKKNNDPFEKLMVKVCPGMFDQKSYRLLVVEVPDDKRKKPIVKTSGCSYSRRVTISKEYQICKYLVTQAQWKAIMGEGFNMSKVRGDDLPVTNVSYEDIMQFIKKLNKLSGKKYRLPTEAEWMWAAMGANKDKDQGIWAGCDKEDKLGDYAWYEKNSENKPHPVGKKKPNELGLYDMSGNVWECCQDFYKEELGNDPVIDPVEAKAKSNYHVARGGCYSWGKDYLMIQRHKRTASSGLCEIGYAYFTYDSREFLGFRLAL